MYYLFICLVCLTLFALLLVVSQSNKKMNEAMKPVFKSTCAVNKASTFLTRLTMKALLTTAQKRKNLRFLNDHCKTQLTINNTSNKILRNYDPHRTQTTRRHLTTTTTMMTTATLAIGTEFMLLRLVFSGFGFGSRYVFRKHSNKIAWKVGAVIGPMICLLAYPFYLINKGNYLPLPDLSFTTLDDNNNGDFVIKKKPRFVYQSREEEITQAKQTARKIVVEENHHFLNNTDHGETISRVERVILDILTVLKFACDYSEEELMRFNVRIIDSNYSDVFVLADGSIFLNTGIFNTAIDDGGLCFILAHEISHVLLHHARENYFPYFTYVLVWDFVLCFVFRNVLFFPITFSLGYLLNDLLENLIKKRIEDEADALGVTLMSLAGYSPVFALEVMQRLGEEELVIVSDEGQHHFSQIQNWKKHFQLFLNNFLPATHFSPELRQEHIHRHIFNWNLEVVAYDVMCRKLLQETQQLPTPSRGITFSQPYESYWEEKFYEEATTATPQQQEEEEFVELYLDVNEYEKKLES